MNFSKSSWNAGGIEKLHQNFEIFAFFVDVNRHMTFSSLFLYAAMADH